jgi:YesN/AraC family two-component response regulator
LSAARVINVVLVDDTPEIRRLLRRGLELVGGFNVVGEAADGLQGVATVSEQKPDAVLLDLAMPVMDGLQAIPKIRESTPRTKILILSGFDETRMSEEAMQAGAHAYLSKGVPITKIASVLKALVE